MWWPTCNCNTCTRGRRASFLILLMMDAWRPKHVEWLCRNKTCIVLHQVGFFIWLMRSVLLLGFYAAYNDSFVPTFRDNLSGPVFKGSSRQRRVLFWCALPWKMGQIRCSETSVRNYHSISKIPPQQRVDLIYTAVEAWTHALLEAHFSVLRTETWVVVADAYNTEKYE